MSYRTNTRSDFYTLNKLGNKIKYTNEDGNVFFGKVIVSKEEEFIVLWEDENKEVKYELSEFSESEIFGLSLAESMEQSIIKIVTAYVNGKPIEYRIKKLDNSTWETIPEGIQVNWNFEVFEYRIKKLPPPPIVKMMFVEANPTLDNAYNKPNLKLSFDPITKVLIKAEIV